MITAEPARLGNEAKLLHHRMSTVHCKDLVKCTVCMKMMIIEQTISIIER